MLIWLCDSNFLLRFKSSVIQCSSDTSGTRYNPTLPNTSEDINLYPIHCEDTKPHRLWLPVIKLRTVIITALAVQVVTAFRWRDSVMIVIASFCCHWELNFCILIAWPIILLQASTTYRCFLWGVVSHFGVTGTPEDYFSDKTFQFD